MSDVEPEPAAGTPADPKQGGLKDQDATKPASGGEHTGQSEVEEEPAHGDKGGGMIGEG